MTYRHLLAAPFLAGSLALTFAAGLSGRHTPDIGTEGMVASAEVHATAAGFEILEAGGNAADAAVAVGFALAVTYPAAGNLGGGGFLVFRSAEGAVSTLDYRETAPQAATANLFLGPDGEPVPELSTRSLLASGVPASVAGMLETFERFGGGKLSLRRVLAPAIRLAEEGFPVYPELAEGLAEDRERLAAIPSTAALLYPGGRPLRTGEIFHQPDLARVLREIAGRGRDGFYRGWVADSLHNFMQQGGGLITRDDLARYRAKPRPPVIVNYKGYRLYSMGPPSSGGVTLGQILGLVEPFDLAAVGRNSALYANHLVEAERLAFADRNHFLADPDFVDVPVAGLLSPEYLAGRRLLMPSGRAGSSRQAGPGRPEPDQTTHFCIVDKWGGAASVTTTLNSGFGNGYMVPGCGFFLNNEMDDFTAAPGRPNIAGLVMGRANAIAPGKRMLSSMTPTIVTRLGDNGTEKLFLVLGASGGPTIITSVLQVFLNVVAFGLNVREAVDAPRFHHQHLPDVVSAEPETFSRETRAALETMGYEINERKYIGRVSAVRVREDGLLEGWADGAGAGSGTGWR
ncbi:MAG: gamma-glutamyltransferase [Candidatus Glassbacteria bacterium]